MNFEKWLASIIKARGINLAEMTRQTKLYYPSIYGSLYGKRGSRELRSSEVIAICRHVGVNPMDFVKEINNRKEHEDAEQQIYTGR